MSKLNILNNFMKNLDYFAVTFQFRINKNKRYSSATGGIIFSLYLILMIIYFIIKYFDYVSWSDTRFQFIDKSPEKSPILNLTKLGFSYAVSIIFDNETSVFDTELYDLFNIEHRFIEYNNTLNTSSTPRKSNTNARNCLENDFMGTLDSDSAIHRTKMKFKCFDINDNFNIQGVYTDNIFSYIELFLTINNKYFSNYTNLERIFKKFQFKYTIYFTDHSVDVGNFTHPVGSNLEAIYTYINFEYYERVNLFFQEYNLCQDQNLIFKEKNCKIFHKFLRYENKMGPYPNRLYLPETIRNSISKFILRVDTTKKIINVNLIKISEFLSNCSAIFVNVLVLIDAVIVPLNEMKARQSINEKVMKLKEIIKIENKDILKYFNEKYLLKKEKEKIKKNKHHNSIAFSLRSENFGYFNDDNKSIIRNFDNSSDALKGIQNLLKSPMSIYDNQIELEIINKSQNKNPFGTELDNKVNKNIFNNIPVENEKRENNSQKNSDIEKEKIENKNIGNLKFRKEIETEIVLKRKNPFKIRMKDYLKMAICNKGVKQKLKINNIADSKFDQTMDITNFMIKMQEIDILKYLILDEDCIKMMNFLSKPKITNQNVIQNKEFEDYFNNDFNDQSKVENLHNLKEAFDKMLLKENINIFTSKIMRLFDYEISNLSN